MNSFFAWPTVSAFFRMMDSVMSRRGRRIPSARALSDHILKDIGLSRCEIPSFERFGGADRSRRQRV
jgi:uncharacterized protein YjiS (DUF1127 family)